MDFYNFTTVREAVKKAGLTTRRQRGFLTRPLHVASEIPLLHANAAGGRLLSGHS